MAYVCGVSEGTLDECSALKQYYKLQDELKFQNLKRDSLLLQIRALKREIARVTDEKKRLQAAPLQVGQFVEFVDEDHAIVQGLAGMNYCVRILDTIRQENLNPMCSVAMHRQSHAIVDVLPETTDNSARAFLVSEKTDITFADIGGLETQKQELREAIELPLTSPHLLSQIGIDPPSGVLLYGQPGTGKTMLAKAIANMVDATFFSLVGSEFVHKYLGEGPRLVREVFKAAKSLAPSIIFIDEIDTIALRRFDAQTGADREVQRILLELVNQMDGFDRRTNVKVIMATNRVDTLDPALLRPGRLDRKIEFQLPDRRQARMIFQICTAKMNLSPDINISVFIKRPRSFNAADIAAVCQAAGLHAIRNHRYMILQEDLEAGWEEHIRNKEQSFQFYSV